MKAVSLACTPSVSLALLLCCLKPTYGGAVLPVNASSSTPVTSSVPSTITTAPNLPISEQVIPINTCSYYNSTISQYQWNDPWCSIKAGTVQLTYWPTNDNYSYPATVYDSALHYTFSSPSVYMVIDTIYAYNPCGALGPTTSNAILAFDLTDVSTLVPHSKDGATTRQSTRQLYLSDLGTNCTQEFDGDIATETYRTKNNINRCNPSLVIPAGIKRLGLPYWNHCGNVENKFGLFDPPYAIQPVDGFFGTTTSDATTSTADTTQSAVTGPSAVPELASRTAEAPQATATIAAPEDSTPAESLTTPAASQSANSAASPTAVNQASSPPEASPEASLVDNPSSTPASEHPTPVGVSPVVSITSPATVDASPIPADADPAVVTTISKQIVSLGSAGLEVIESGESSTYAVPAIGATEPGVGVGPASTMVYQGLTLTAGGAAKTVTNAVVVAPSSPAGYVAGNSGNRLANVTSTTPLVTGSGERLMGGIMCLVVSVLAAIVVL